MPQSNQSDEPAMSVTTLAIQPPVQLSAVTRVSRASRSRSPALLAMALSSSSLGPCMGWQTSRLSRPSPRIDRSAMATAADQHTPLMKQFFAAKADYPDVLLFFRMGDF